MSRFTDWLEDNYYYLVMIVVVALFAFGGVATCSDKHEEKVSTDASERRQEIDEHRKAFFEKYSQFLPQFLDWKDFSHWIDTADKESIVLLHGVVEANGYEYQGDEGFADMIDYLQIVF